VAALTERAFGEFYHRTARPLWVYVYRVTGNAADADDIVQDAFCRMLGADVDALGDEDRRRYLFRVASNLAADRWRRAERERSWRERAGPVAPASAAPADAPTALTFQALKPQQRALLWLAYVEESSHEEIAAAMGLKRGSVKVLLARARAQLKALLKTKAIR
jgi:RNA polymerase sigma-70 factor (ECF subfamily)